jgi:hypothetical protein
MIFSMPTSAFGYYRGAPQFGGGAHTGEGSGPNVAGMNVFSQGQGTDQSSSAWSPTILYMIALIILEMIVFGFISRRL